LSSAYTPCLASPDPHSFPTRRSSDLGRPVDLEVVSLVGPGGARGDGPCLGAERHTPGDDLDLDLIGDRVAGRAGDVGPGEVEVRSEEHTSELQSRENLVCRLLLEKKK